MSLPSLYNFVYPYEDGWNRYYDSPLAEIKEEIVYVNEMDIEYAYETQPDEKVECYDR